jgi:hypothetical protein
MKRIYFVGFLLLTTVLCSFIVASSESINAGEKLQPLVTTSELVVGQNRFAFGLMKAGKLLQSAAVVLRLYALDGPEAKLNGEFAAIYQPIEASVDGAQVHQHSDGTRHVHDSDSAVRGLYIGHINFPQAGEWGVQIAARQANGPTETASFTVTVLDAPATPAIGTAAPRTQNLIASDVEDLREIDTSSTPDPRLHQVRIADAIAQHKPQMIVFATPQFCTSRMCGPVVDIVRGLLPRYGQQIAFTHQEIWQDFPNHKPFPTITEWRLRSEPWIFVVDGDGMIRNKFEGLVTMRELEASLQQVLKQSSSRD